jgi:protein subunit release factor A
MKLNNWSIINQSYQSFEVQMLVSKEYDDCDAIFEMHPGAGGTESKMCAKAFSDV